MKKYFKHGNLLFIAVYILVFGKVYGSVLTDAFDLDASPPTGSITYEQLDGKNIQLDLSGITDNDGGGTVTTMAFSEDNENYEPSLAAQFYNTNLEPLLHLLVDMNTVHTENLERVIIR